MNWSGGWSPKRLNVETKSIRRLEKCPPCRLSSSLQPTRLQQKHLETFTAVSVVTKVLKAKLVMFSWTWTEHQLPKDTQHSVWFAETCVSNIYSGDWVAQTEPGWGLEKIRFDFPTSRSKYPPCSDIKSGHIHVMWDYNLYIRHKDEQICDLQKQKWILNLRFESNKLYSHYSGHKTLLMLNWEENVTVAVVLVLLFKLTAEQVVFVVFCCWRSLWGGRAEGRATEIK